MVDGLRTEQPFPTFDTVQRLEACRLGDYRAWSAMKEAFSGPFLFIGRIRACPGRGQRREARGTKVVVRWTPMFDLDPLAGGRAEFGVIDLGSNSLRLASSSGSGPRVSALYEKGHVRLGARYSPRPKPG